jgi:hypothetical protein
MANTDWTLLTLYAFFKAEIKGLRASFKTYQATTQEAILKADRNNERRFENTNEWREQLDNERKTYATREMVDSAIRRVDGRIDDLSERESKTENKQSNNDGRAAGISFAISTIIGLIVAVLGYLNSNRQPQIVTPSPSARQTK